MNSKKKNFWKHIGSLGIVVLLLLGCAKELPDNIPEDIQNNVHSISLFDEEVIIETIENHDAVKKTLTSNKAREVQRLFDSNKKQLRYVKVVSGPKKLRRFFEHFRIQSHSVGEQVRISFKLTDNTMIAYAHVPTKKLSDYDKHIIHEGRIPLFTYPIDSYGSLNRAANDLGEETTSVIFRISDKSQASHVRIESSLMKRSILTLRGQEDLPEQVILVKEHVDGNILNLGVLKSFIENYRLISVRGDISDKNSVKLRVKEKTLQIMAPKRKSNFTDIEKIRYNVGPEDQRVEDCGEKLAKAASIDQEDCVAVALYSLPIEHVKPQTSFNEDKNIFKVKYHLDNDPQKASFLRINFAKPLQEVSFGPSSLNLSADELITLKDEDYDLSSVYLYSPMVLKAPEMMGIYYQYAIPVHLQFSQKGLIAKKQDAPNESIPFLKIRGRHFDPRCRQHLSGKCLQEDGTSLAWRDKRFLLLRFQDTTFSELNPMNVWNVDDSQCLKKVESDLERYSLEKGTISFQVKNTYRIVRSASCTQSTGHIGLPGQLFQVVFLHTFKRLSDLASTNYQKVDYPRGDQRFFGLFATRFVDEHDEVHFYLNRWNANKKIIRFHLSDIFNDPKQKVFKETTYKVFDRINQALVRAKTGLQVQLVEPSGKQLGDMSFSMIQLFSDYTPRVGSSGILGIAPVVTDPSTGEILSSDIQVFTEPLFRKVPHIWEEMREIFQLQKRNQQENNEKIAEHSTKLSENDEMKKTVSGHLSPVTDHFEPTPLVNPVKRVQNTARPSRPSSTQNLDDNICLYTDEKISDFNVGESILSEISKITGVFDKNGALKKWSDLGDKAQRTIEESIVAHLYANILLHETAHSFALRHNFLGSFDEKNFYSLEEIKEFGLNKIPPYSSISDYIFNHPLDNKISVYGKYDIAALRFAYAREVEVTKNNSEAEFVPIENNLQDMTFHGLRLKHYLYCTDHEVGLVNHCSRSDTGTNATDVVKHLLKTSDIYYKRANFRGERKFFSIEDLTQYFQNRERSFNSLRGFYWDWEDRVYSYGMSSMTNGCPIIPGRSLSPNCKDINDYKDAFSLVGKFLLKTISEPEYSCIHKSIINANDRPVFTEMVYIYNQLAYSIDYVPESCFDPAVKAYFANSGRKIIAEGGRYINSFYDHYGTYTLGNWIDRLLAAQVLFHRSDSGGAFVDHPVLGPQVNKVLTHLLLGDPAILSGTFRQENGEAIVLDYALPSNQILLPPEGVYSLWIRQFFDLPEAGSAFFAKSLLQQIVNWGQVYEVQDKEYIRSGLNAYTIRKSDISEGTPDDNLAHLILNDAVYSATSTNELAYRMINAYHDFLFLRGLKRETVETSVEKRNFPPKMPDSLDEDLREIYVLNDSDIEYLLSVARRGAILNPQKLISWYGPFLGVKFYRGHLLGEAKLRRVKAIRKNQMIPKEFLPECYSAFSCPWGDIVRDEDVDPDIRKLYNTNLETVKDFVSGKLEKSVERFLSRIDFFPNHVSN